MRTRIPFEGIGIVPAVGQHIVDVTQRLLAEKPNSSVEVQAVVAETGYSGAVVKKVFYVLLVLRVLKATFLPRHRVCGNIIGKQELSAETIREKARAGEYSCLHCFEQVEEPEDVEIQIVFWRPGANVSGG